MFVSVFCLFLSPRLILQKSNGSFQRKISFFKVLEGVKIFPGGSNFFQGGVGSICLFPIETQITCDFPVCPDPLPPSGSALGCDLFSFPVGKMKRSPLAPVFVFLQLRCMFSVRPRKNIVS